MHTYIHAHLHTYTRTYTHTQVRTILTAFHTNSFGLFSSQCSLTCGQGIKRRVITCSLENGKANDLCDRRTKPADREPCNVHPCPRWSVGNWSEVRDHIVCLFVCWNPFLLSSEQLANSYTHLSRSIFTVFCYMWRRIKRTSNWMWRREMWRKNKTTDDRCLQTKNLS